MEEFKNYYKYQNLFKLLKIVSKDKLINYTNFKLSINNILIKCFNKNTLEFNLVKLSSDLMNIKYLAFFNKKIYILKKV